MQQDANLVEIEKCCQTHIFLQNFVLIQPRTSPPKICKILLIIFPILLISPSAMSCPTSEASSARLGGRPGVTRTALLARDPFHDARERDGLQGRVLHRNRIRQTLEGSFSAVSKPKFASKYAFESSRRDLLTVTSPNSLRH